MKKLALLGAFLLTGMGISPSVNARTSEPPTDAHGRPLFDSDGQAIFYTDRDPIGDSSNEAVQSKAPAGVMAHAAAVSTVSPWETPASPGGSPFWAYGIFGTQIGQAGMLPVSTPNGMELFVSATGNSGFGSNNFWYVLRHDAASGAYQQIHVQPPYTPLTSSDWYFSITSMVLANVAGGSEPELVVGLSDGRFFFYTPSTRQQIGTIRPVTTVKDFRAADLNGDGVAELIITSDTDLKVFNAAGQQLWSVAGPSGSDLVIAQMDADAALEIATTSGHVVDAETHTVQWARGSSFGAHLRAADIDGDGRAELIAAESWYNIYAYDVDLQTTKWSFRTGLDISSIEIANADADPAPELLYGDNQHGSVHVLSLGATTPVEKWYVSNPSSGIPRILIADADNDGVRELLWGGGSNTTGSDHLYVVSTVTKLREWSSIHLDGPFLSPVLGDLNGDGKPELVTASTESASGYDSGRILVFDSETLALLATSEPIAQNYSWTGLRDLKLKDVNNDGRAEIIIASDWLYDGIIEIYSFTDAGTFELKWTNPTRPDGAPFSQVEVLDVDGDGTLEIVAGNDREHTGSSGTYVTVLDYATKATEWTSPHMGGYWASVQSLAVGDVDGDGRLEAIAVTSGIGIFVYDLVTHTQEFSLAGDYQCVVTREGQTGFHAGLTNGSIVRFAPNGSGGYAAAATWKASNSAITGLTNGPGQALWISTGGRLYLWPDSLQPIWASAVLGTAVSGRVAVADSPTGTDLYAGLGYGVAAFHVGGGTEFVTASVKSTGFLLEGNPSTATVTLMRSAASETALTVQFELNGTATPGEDYNVSGATALGGRKYSVVIPAGSLETTITLRALADRQAEGLEYIRAGLLAGNGYFLGSPMEAVINVVDDEPEVSVVASDAEAGELRIGRVWDIGMFTLTRTGDITRPLLVRFALEGSARNGIDYRRTTGAVIFRRGDKSAAVRIVPRQDGDAEPDENVQLRLLPSKAYLVAKDAPAASLTIHDGEPEVTLSGVTSIPGGMAVNLTRSGGHTKSFSVYLAISREEANGSFTIDFRRVRFPSAETTTSYLFFPASGATGTATISVDLIENNSFHVGETTSVSFELPAIQIPPAE